MSAHLGVLIQTIVLHHLPNCNIIACGYVCFPARTGNSLKTGIRCSGKVNKTQTPTIQEFVMYGDGGVGKDAHFCSSPVPGRRTKSYGLQRRDQFILPRGIGKEITPVMTLASDLTRSVMFQSGRKRYFRHTDPCKQNRQQEIKWTIRGREIFGDA